MKFKLDWFLWGMAAAVGLAWVFPGPGARGGWMHPELVTKLGVALIFFLHGAALSFAALKAGTMRWRLHLVVQACTYLFFPVIGVVLLALIGTRLPADLRLGIFYLCALPSTVSSSVAMTAAARGNVPAAVFNATLSSLIGIFLTPLWISVWVNTSGHGLPLGKVILDLVLWLLLPLVLGQVSRPLIGGWIAKRKKQVNVVDRCTILLMLYTSFCDSVRQGVWTGHGVTIIVAVIVGSAVLFFLVMESVNAVCRWLKFETADRIAAVFCGSKKTLASGVPMAQLMFAGYPGLGLIVLPIMIYHPMQLIICGVLAGRWAQRKD